MALSEYLTKREREKYFAEFCGTFYLVLIIKLASVYSEYAAFGIGFSLAVWIYSFGYISQAHINPALSFALCLHEQQIDYIQLIFYWLSQFSGGIVGGYTAWLIGGENAAVAHTFVNENVEVYRAFFGEFFFTYALITVAFHLGASYRQKTNQFYGWGVGMTLMVSIFSIGPITGSAINPAVWLGTVLSAISCRPEIKLSHVWIYWVAEFGAALVSVFTYQVFHADIDVNDEKQGKTDDNEEKDENKSDKKESEDIQNEPKV